MHADSHRDTASEQRGLEPLRALVHPLWLGAFGVLLLNDYVLKASLDAPLLTGKLSDVAGLIVAPVVLAAILRVRRSRGLWLSAAAVVAVFSAINLSPTAAGAWDAGVAAVFGSSTTWTDPTDLLALPAAALGVWALTPAMAQARPNAMPGRRGATWALAAGAAIACLGSTGPLIGPEFEDRRELQPTPFQARVALLNQTHELQAFRIRHLAPGVDLDCERVSEAPNEYLTDEAFGEPTRWELLSGQQVGLGGAGQRGSPDGSREGCRAALVATDAANDVIVFWNDDLEVKQFDGNPSGDKNELGGSQIVEFTADYSDANSDEVRDFRYRPCREDNICGDTGRQRAAERPEGVEYSWNLEDDPRLGWIAPDRNERDRREISRSCRRPIEHPGLSWEGLPNRRHELRELIRGDDGCHRLKTVEWAPNSDRDPPVRTATLCAPWNAVSQLQGGSETTRLVRAETTSTFGQGGGSVVGLRIDVSELTESTTEEVGTLKLTYGVPGPPLPRSVDFSIPVGCGPQPQSCGRVDLPARLELPGADTSEPVGVGREVTLDSDQRVRLVRVLYRAVSRPQGSCTSEEESGNARRESEALQGSTGIYVEAVTSEGFDP